MKLTAKDINPACFAIMCTAPISRTCLRQRPISEPAQKPPWATETCSTTILISYATSRAAELRQQVNINPSSRMPERCICTDMYNSGPCVNAGIWRQHIRRQISDLASAQSFWAAKVFCDRQYLHPGVARTPLSWLHAAAHTRPWLAAPRMRPHDASALKHLPAAPSHRLCMLAAGMLSGHASQWAAPPEGSVHPKKGAPEAAGPLLCVAHA